MSCPEFVLFIFAVLLSAAVSAKVPCEEKLRICKSRNPTRPVCGSDNKTYVTRCHLVKARCDGQISLMVVHRGPCSDKEQPCWADQGVNKGGEDGTVFVPRCLPDGKYAPVQCHEGTGYCWCVTPQGKPLSNTSVRHATPKCNRAKTRRGGRRRRKVCGKIERINFINNLVKIFRTEYERTLDDPESANETEIEKIGVEWKFNILDLDKNKNLTIEEYKDLRKLVRKAVKPKKCSRSFARYCDVNKDTIISYEEWTLCLVKKQVNKKKKDKPKKKIGRDSDFGVGIRESSLISTYGLEMGIEDPPIERKEEPEVNDCLSDRKSVLEEQKQTNIEIYIPECAMDGRYQKVQCYRSTGYCWCVHEDTGKPIPGTSVKDVKPKCDEIQLPIRPMKGCPEQKRQAFLKELMEFITKQKPMGSDFNAMSGNFQSENEKISAWIFQSLDLNKNKVLEKKETKSFRTMMMNQKNLKQCGKKLPRYCDVNHDRKISLTEWLNCLNAERSSIGMTITASPVRRRGPNPLDTILKAD